MIAIIDYGLGNVMAFANIYKNLDIPFKIAKYKDDLTMVTKIILPGVGAFDHAMQRLQESGMREAIDELVLEKKLPIIGICVGMQMLAKSSDEGNLQGLGWIDAKVKKFDKTLLDKNSPLPHMGWNSIKIARPNALMSEIDDEARFYFLHSYYFECNQSNECIATAFYGNDFTCIVNKQNIYGVQFHPEKSHHNGIKLLHNFGRL